MLKNWWEKYKKKETLWGHLSNVIFIAFVVALLFPTSRQWVSSNLIKLTLFDRGEIELPENPIRLDTVDKKLTLYGKNQAIDFQSLDGEVIIINSWATWCPPCIAEMPNFQNLYNDYNDRVVFLFITGDTMEKSMAFLNKNGYDLPVYQYSQLPASFSHSSIPTTFVLNRKSEIVFTHTGAYKWDGTSFRNFLDLLIQQE